MLIITLSISKGCSFQLDFYFLHRNGNSLYEWFHCLLSCSTCFASQWFRPDVSWRNECWARLNGWLGREIQNNPVECSSTSRLTIGQPVSWAEPSASSVGLVSVMKLIRITGTASGIAFPFAIKTAIRIKPYVQTIYPRKAQWIHQLITTKWRTDKP